MKFAPRTRSKSDGDNGVSSDQYFRTEAAASVRIENKNGMISLVIVSIAAVALLGSAMPYISPTMRGLSLSVHAQDIRSQPVPFPILFVNFHQSGGDYMCEAMKRSKSIPITDMNGSLVKTGPDLRGEKNLNCNTPFSSPEANAEIFQPLQSCDYLVPYTTNSDGKAFQRNNFIGVEVPFREEMPCPMFRSFAMMRDPVNRFLSQMKAHNWDEKLILKWSEDRDVPPDHYLMERFPTLNNMVIRQLLGRERWLDPFPIDEMALEKAKKAVDSFNAFVPTERMYEPKVQALLEREVPEVYEAVATGYFQAHLQSNLEPDARRGASEELLRVIEEENKYDIMLYRYIQEKMRL